MLKFSVAALAALLLVSGNNLVKAESPIAEDAVPGAVTRHLDLQDGDDAEYQLAHHWHWGHRGFWGGRGHWGHRGFWGGGAFFYPRVYTYRPFWGAHYYQPFYTYRPYAYWW